MRDVVSILSEWRALEHDRDEAIDGDVVAVLNARIEVVRAEYAMAMDDRDVEAPGPAQPQASNTVRLSYVPRAPTAPSHPGQARSASSR